MFKFLLSQFVKKNGRNPNAIEMLQLKFKASQGTGQVIPFPQKRSFGEEIDSMIKKGEVNVGTADKTPPYKPSKSQTDFEIQERYRADNAKAIKRFEEKMKKDPEDPQKFYRGGQAMIEPDLSDIGHGSDALMARNTLLTPGSQATTSTGLNYLLGEDNDTTRVPYGDGFSVQPFISASKSNQGFEDGINVDLQDLTYGGNVMYDKGPFSIGIEHLKGKDKFDFKYKEDTIVKDTSDRENTNLLLAIDIANTIKGKARLNKDGGQFEISMPFAEGGRIPYGDGDMVLPKEKPMDEYMLKQVLSPAGIRTLDPKTREMFIEMYKKKIREKNSKADGGRTEFKWGGPGGKSPGTNTDGSAVGSGTKDNGGYQNVHQTGAITQTPGRTVTTGGPPGGGDPAMTYTAPKTGPVTTGGQSPFAYTKPEPKSYNYGITSNYMNPTFRKATIDRIKQYQRSKQPKGWMENLTDIYGEDVRTVADYGKDTTVIDAQARIDAGVAMPGDVDLVNAATNKTTSVPDLSNPDVLNKIAIDTGMPMEGVFTKTPTTQTTRDIKNIQDYKRNPDLQFNVNDIMELGIGQRLGQPQIQSIYDMVQAPGQTPFMAAQGGPARQNFKMGKRAFLKLMGGVGAGIAGLKSGLLGLGKGATKKAVTETVKQTAGSGTPPPYFLNLVKKIKTLGDDTLATKDKAIAKKYKDYTMEEDFAGNIEIIKKGDDVAEDVFMSYKIDDVPVKGKKGSSKVEDYEEYTARPDAEGKMKDIEPGVPDEVVQEGSMFEDNLSDFGKADGGRIGYKLGKKVVETVIKKAGEGKFTKNEVLLNMFQNTIKETKDVNTKTRFLNFIEEIKAKPELSKDPQVWNFFTKGLPKNQKLVVYGDDTVDFWTQSDFGPHNIATSAKFQKKHPYLTKDQAIKIQNMEPEDQIFEMKRLEAIRKRTANASGGIAAMLGE